MDSYLASLYFVMSSLTSVGFGNIAAYSIYEQGFRLVFKNFPLYRNFREIWNFRVIQNFREIQSFRGIQNFREIQSFRGIQNFREIWNFRGIHNFR